LGSSILLEKHIESLGPQEINLGKGNQRDFVNSAHGIHKYTARMIPPISRYLIEKYSAKGELVLDPFCGSGTTLLEAYLQGRQAVGIDLNPLAKLISKVKTTPMDECELKTAIDLLLKRLRSEEHKASIVFPNIDYWFCKKAQDELNRIRYCIDTIDGEINDGVRDFMLVSFSSIVRKSSYADPRMAKTYKSKRVLQKIDNGWVPTPIKYFEETLKKNYERITSTFKQTGSNCEVRAFIGDARNTSLILKKNRIDRVDLVITSPPYINAQDYFRSYKLELWWLGLATPTEVNDLKRKAIGSENVSSFDCNEKPESDCTLLNRVVREVWSKNNLMSKEKAYIIWQYFENMKLVFERLNCALKNGGVFCLVTGNNTICGVQIPAYKILMQIANDFGFTTLENYRDKIRNRSLFPDRNHKCGIIKEEWITVFQKP
jgi:DNA modification methylase